MTEGRLRYYIDLIAVILLTVLCILFVLVEPFNKTPLRIPFSLLILLFLPGYALIAAMFPRMGEISGIERFTLAIGLSIAITVFDGFAISVTPYLFRPTPLVLTLSAITTLLVLVTVLTRTLTSKDRRYFLDYQGFIESLRADDEKMSDVERMLMISLIGSIIIASSMLIYAKVTFDEEEFSALYILGPDGKAEGYQKDLHIGEPQSITVGVENYEHAATEYTLQVKLGAGVLETRRISLKHKEKWLEDLSFVPDRTGDHLKLAFDLHKGGVGGGVPYRSVHLWVNSTIDYNDTSTLLNYLITPPVVPNGGMEENSSWVFTNSTNFTCSCANVSYSSAHSYRIASTRPGAGHFGTITQEIASPKPGLAVLEFSVRDSILTNTTGYLLQVLLNDAIVWEKSTALDRGWEQIRFPVMLRESNRLAITVHSEKSNPDIVVLWDDVRFETLTTINVSHYEPSIHFDTPTNVSVVIESYEPAYTNYTLSLRLGGDLVSEQEVGIASCSESVVNMTFTPKMIGSYLPLEFQLLKGNITHRHDLRTVSCSVDYTKIDSAMNYTTTPPLIPNGDMEYDGYWKYSGRGNLTGNYTSDAATLGHRSYQIATTNRTVYGDSGTISQDIAGEDGIVLLAFDVMDSQTSDSAGQHTKQVLLNDILVWEDDCAGDNGWQRVETPVILKSNNTLTIAVSEGDVGRETDLQVWWDNIEFRRFEGEGERETVVAGHIPSVQLSSIPMAIHNGSTMRLTSSNCDQLNSNEQLELYFSEDGVVDTENATYTVSIRTSSGSISYLGERYGCPTSEPDVLLPVIVDGGGRTMHANETWNLGSGYNLTIRDVDAVSEVALLELNKSHETINKTINETLDSGIFGEDERFEYRTDVGGVDDDTLQFRCTVDDILLDQSVEIDDLYLYSDTPVYVNRGDRYGEFEIDEIKSDKIIFKNRVGITFSGTCSILNDTIRFRVSDNRRYAYLYTTKTRSGTYRLEGSSYSAEAGKWMNLSGENHPAFCNDPETGISYEELKVYFSSERFIEAENATYTVSVIGGETGFLGELHRSFDPVRADLLGRILVNDSGDEAEIRLNIGESYVLREDCLLTLKDIFITGGVAWFELTKEGKVVESSVCAEGDVVERKVSITGRDATVFECTVNTVFHDDECGFVVLKDIKQFSDDVRKINIGGNYGECGKFKVSKITADRIVITNDESITINDETSILDGWLKFDVSGDRVTPYVELQLGGGR